MFGWRKRIGYIGPTVMEVVPYEFYKFAPDGVGLVGVTCNIDDWSLEWFDKALAQVAAAAAYLGSRGVNFVVHGGGPLVVARGKGFDEIIINDIEKAAGVRATTGVRAAMEALRHVGARRIAIASPYPERTIAPWRTIWQRRALPSPAPKAWTCLSSGCKASRLPISERSPKKY